VTRTARSNGRRISGSFVRKSLSYLALFLFALFALYPISPIITIALRPSDQLLSTSLALIPNGATLANFRILLTETAFLRWVGNA
jgi:arabinogalactan oligomer/maltooligosaccharide transport system permease protein